MYLSFRRFLWLGPLTVFTSVVAVLIVRIIAIASLQPAPGFLPLGLLPPVLDTTILVTWAVIVFAVMIRFVPDPIRKFKTVALVVLLLSFLPDAALVQRQMWGATWSYVFALMTMHIAAWAACVTVLTRFGPTAAMPSKVRMHRQHIGRLIFMAVLAGILTLPVTWRGKLALVAIAMICGMYAMAFQRLRKRRIGSAAVGSFYDMLEHDKRKAMEIIVEKKAEEQMPEDAEGGPDPSR